jgi:hypothetical protein
LAAAIAVFAGLRGAGAAPTDAGQVPALHTMSALRTAAPRERWVVTERNTGNPGLAVAGDDSVYAIGTSPPSRMDCLAEPPETAVWLMHYGSDGKTLWRRKLRKWHVIDLRLAPDQSVCAATHAYGRVSLRCYRPNGKALPVRSARVPDAQRALLLRDGSLVFAGHGRVDIEPAQAGARNRYIAAWLGRFTRGKSDWTRSLGAEGGFSSLQSLAETRDGAIVAAGAMTNEKGSQHQRPWIGEWSARGELLWSDTAPKLGPRSMVSALSVAEDGSLWTSGRFEEASWLRHYDPRGALLGETELPGLQHVFSLLAVDGAVVVGGMASMGPLRAYDTAGKLLWSIDRKDCSVERLERRSRGFVAAWSCVDDLSSVAYDWP